MARGGGKGKATPDALLETLPPPQRKRRFSEVRFSASRVYVNRVGSLEIS